MTSEISKIIQPNENSKNQEKACNLKSFIGNLVGFGIISTLQWKKPCNGHNENIMLCCLMIDLNSQRRKRTSTCIYQARQYSVYLLSTKR